MISDIGFFLADHVIGVKSDDTSEFDEVCQFRCRSSCQVMAFWLDGWLMPESERGHWFLMPGPWIPKMTLVLKLELLFDSTEQLRHQCEA